MDPLVRRTRHERRRHAGEPTLAQTFTFGADVRAEAVCDVLRSAPLVGTDSIFGERPGSEERVESEARRLVGFSPAPGFLFDVELSEHEDGLFIASFSQPDRSTPYLEGDAVWFVSDGSDGAVFEEEINTDRARAAGATSLTGSRPSPRRWLFFRVGHGQVMKGATDRVARQAKSN